MQKVTYMCKQILPIYILYYFIQSYPDNFEFWYTVEFNPVVINSVASDQH